MEKIDLNKIRGKWIDYGDGTGNTPMGCGDDTIASIKMVAEKINEIIDALTSSK